MVGSRHLARSDHDLVWVLINTVPLPKHTKPTWGARRFRPHTDIQAVVGAPLQQEDTHAAISRIALNTTVQGKYTSKFTESTALKMARQRAHQAAPHEAREAWKRVNRMRKQELRAWHGNLVVRASQIDWYAYRTLSHLQRREGWHHKLVDEGNWKQTMAAHFKGIFAKAPSRRTARQLGDTRKALTALCKVTPWRPFTIDELKVATVKWKSGKSTGPDAITHEILRYLLNDDRWGFRLAHMMSDFLYKGELPEGVLKGITVLLPKTLEDPASWGDTRPITLSSSVLKWFSQLLLKRCGGKIQDGAPYQWACRGKQAPELLVILRRVVRMAKEWGTPTWIIKLDVSKAFDSVWQESMGELVGRRVGGLRAGGGGTPGGEPWEARAWLALLEARELNIAVADEVVSVPQSNGVRQGSPDSPVLFSRIIADDLQEALRDAQPLLGENRGPPPPHSGGAFMDDTYLWGYSKEHLQYALASLERRLASHGLAINPGKTAIIHSQPQGGGTFLIGGEEVACKPHGTVITALGSPITFGDTVPVLVAEMQHRARKAFHKNAKLLCAPTPLKARLTLHQALVRGAALWGGQSWPVTDAILRAVNSTQLQQIRRMMHPGRKAGETWAEWNIRTLRGARVALQQSKVVRWSSFQLQHTWELYGHMARSKHGGRDMLQWRNLKWWEAEKQKPKSQRVTHAHRYNPFVDTERQIVRVATLDWMEKACNMPVWSALATEFVKQFDVPWATGKQASIQNLVPNMSSGHRGARVASEAEELTAEQARHLDI